MVVLGQMKRCITIMPILLEIFAVLASAGAQQPSTATGVGSRSAPISDTANLPIETIGPNDLIGISVYESPELTRTFRVSPDGEITLPMLPDPIVASGLKPRELEKVIRAALIKGEILYDPTVTVTIMEFRSRPISVAGAVRNPITFQGTGTVTLIDALSQAGGLSESAGDEIIVSRPPVSIGSERSVLDQRISAHDLFAGNDSSLNLQLQGGEVIRVPEAGLVYVVGDVKKPGSFRITDGEESSVLKAIALSEGLDQHSSHTAYIYRAEAGRKGKSEIKIDLKRILDRKSDDVPLISSDVLYIPVASGRKAALTALDRSLLIGVGLAGALIYLIH